jgi:hypothetical protein
VSAAVSLFGVLLLYSPSVGGVGTTLAPRCIFCRINNTHVYKHSDKRAQSNIKIHALGKFQISGKDGEVSSSQNNTKTGSKRMAKGRDKEAPFNKSFYFRSFVDLKVVSSEN